MNKTHTINIVEGQTLLLYKGDKILLQKKHDCNSTITTSWDSFVGNDEEVAAKIASLKLSEIVKPKTPKAERKPVFVSDKKKPIKLTERLLNFFKAIFSK